MGKYTPIDSVVIQFSQVDLHRLASGDIDFEALYMTTEHEELAIDSMSIIRLGTQDLLIDACAHTRELTRIPMLVNSMTFSWRAKNGTLHNIRTDADLIRALDHSLAHDSTELIIQCNTNLLHFDTVFTGVNLDQVDTCPFPRPRLTDLSSNLPRRDSVAPFDTSMEPDMEPDALSMNVHTWLYLTPLNPILDPANDISTEETTSSELLPEDNDVALPYPMQPPDFLVHPISTTSLWSIDELNRFALATPPEPSLHSLAESRPPSPLLDSPTDAIVLRHNDHRLDVDSINTHSCESLPGNSDVIPFFPRFPEYEPLNDPVPRTHVCLLDHRPSFNCTVDLVRPKVPNKSLRPNPIPMTGIWLVDALPLLALTPLAPPDDNGLNPSYTNISGSIDTMFDPPEFACSLRTNSTPVRATNLAAHPGRLIVVFSQFPVSLKVQYHRILSCELEPDPHATAISFDLGHLLATSAPATSAIFYSSNFPSESAKIVGDTTLQVSLLYTDSTFASPTAITIGPGSLIVAFSNFYASLKLCFPRILSCALALDPHATALSMDLGRLHIESSHPSPVTLSCDLAPDLAPHCCFVIDTVRSENHNPPSLVPVRMDWPVTISDILAAITAHSAHACKLLPPDSATKPIPQPEQGNSLPYTARIWLIDEYPFFSESHPSCTQDMTATAYPYLVLSLDDHNPPRFSLGTDHLDAPATLVPSTIADTTPRGSSDHIFATGTSPAITTACSLYPASALVRTMAVAAASGCLIVAFPQFQEVSLNVLSRDVLSLSRDIFSCDLAPDPSSSPALPVDLIVVSSRKTLGPFLGNRKILATALNELASLFISIPLVSTPLARFHLSLPSFGDSAMPNLCLPILASVPHYLLVMSVLPAATLSHDASFVWELLSFAGNLDAFPTSFKHAKILLGSATAYDSLPDIESFLTMILALQALVVVTAFCEPLHLLWIVASCNIDGIGSVVASLLLWTLLTMMSPQPLRLIFIGCARRDVFLLRSFFATQHAGSLALWKNSDRSLLVSFALSVSVRPSVSNRGGCQDPLWIPPLLSPFFLFCPCSPSRSGEGVRRP
jgi:hypothetical protein